MDFVLTTKRSSRVSFWLMAIVALLFATQSFAQLGGGGSQVRRESVDFRTVSNGRWVDIGTWEVFRSGRWISAQTANAGIPDANRNVFIETNHTIIATRAQVQNGGAVTDYAGNQLQAFIEVNDLHINTAASITTTWGVLPGRIHGVWNGVTYADAYDGDRFGGVINASSQVGSGTSDHAWYNGGTLTNIDGTDQILSGTTVRGIDPATGGFLARPRNNELRVYGKLRYYAGAALNSSDRDAQIQVTAATIGTGSTIVFRGSTRKITAANEWSTTLATRTGRFDNSVFSQGHAGIADALTDESSSETVLGQPVRQRDNYRGLMGRNSFWTAIFDLGRVRDRAIGSRNTGLQNDNVTPAQYDYDVFENMNDNAYGVRGEIEGAFTAGIIQIRRGTVRVTGWAFLANEGAATSGSIQIMNGAVLQVDGNTQIGRTAVPALQFNDNAGGTTPVRWYGRADGTGTVIRSTPQGPYYVTSRMRYFVVEEGGALEFTGQVGMERDEISGDYIVPGANVGDNPLANIHIGASLSAADVRFNGTVIYSRTSSPQNLVEDSPFLSFNPAGTQTNGATPYVGTTGGINMGENGIYDPYNNLRDPYNQTSPGAFGAVPAATYAIGTANFGVGAAGVFAPSTTAAYSHLVLSGSGNKYMIATTVTISRTLIFQGTAKLQLNGDRGQFYRNYVTAAEGGPATGVNNQTSLQPTGGELGQVNPLGAAPANPTLSRYGFYPPLVYLRSTGLYGFKEEHNVGTTYRRSMINAATNDVVVPMWSAYGGNTDPVIWVGYTTASTSIRSDFIVGSRTYPVGMVLSASTNREQMDMTPWNKPGVVHGLPAEPSYIGNTATYNLTTHGWAARGLQYGVQTLAGDRFGQVIRQSIDRVNGSWLANVMQIPVTPGENLVALNHNAASTNFSGNWPMITNSLYDYAINTTATTTLQYDSEQSDVMSQIELPQGVAGPHNLVLNSPNNVTQLLPIRTFTLEPYNSPGGANNVLWGVTAATVILGPEYTNSDNGNLPRHAFNPTTGQYQADAIYDREQSATSLPTAGVAASAYVDTRPDVADTRHAVGVLTFNGTQTAYNYPWGMRPLNDLTGTFDGRVRVGFPAQATQTPMVNAYASLGWTGGTFNNTGSVTDPGRPMTSFVNGTYQTNDANDFGRRGDFNNFGVLELRRGTLEIPSFLIEGRRFPGGERPANREARLFTYTFTMVTAAIMSGDQAKVVYRGNPTGEGQTAQVLLSDDPDGGQGKSTAAVGAAGGPAPIGYRAAAAKGGGGVLRGPAGPLNLFGTLKGGSLSNMVFIGGTGGTFSNAAVATARQNGYRPPTYEAKEQFNNGLTELDMRTGVLGALAVAPSWLGTSDILNTGGTGIYNPGPEQTTDVDFNVSQPTFGTLQSRSSKDGAQPASTFSGNNRAKSGTAGHVLRANNAYNIDMPRVVGGLQHLSFMRATTNVLTLLGNESNDKSFPVDGLTTRRPEDAGLQIYGTIATARGDIDLNGRNIELGGNTSKLVETFEKTQFVDSVTGQPLWAYPTVQYAHRTFNGGVPTAGTAYPTAPSSVRNTHYNVRSYIGLTSPRNIEAMNHPGGATGDPQNTAGLGAMIYSAGSDQQYRVRRWQTRGNGSMGALTTRPGVRTQDRYWQIETTGTLDNTILRTELRLQYIDTDLNNENGTTLGLPPASLNIFRTAGQNQITPQNSQIGLGPVTFQALFAQLRVGLDSYNFHKQLTLIGRTVVDNLGRARYVNSQVVNGVEVLNTANFTTLPNTNDVEATVAPGNAQNPKSGFQLWTIGIPAPNCIVFRGQRFGGAYGDAIGGVPINLAGNHGNGTERSGLLPGNGGPANGGIQQGTIDGTVGGVQYRLYVGPFKAGIPTVATIVADLLDDFGNVATTNFTTGATLVISSPNDGYPARLFHSSSQTNAVSGGGGTTVGGHFEWTGIRIDGIASTQLSLSVINTYGNGAVAPNTASTAVPAGYSLPNCDKPTMVALQGGIPYSVTFATVTGTETSSNPIALVPGRVNGLGRSINGPTTSQCGASNITVGLPVNFNNQYDGATNRNAITVHVRDRFGNLSSFTTVATITIAGGQPLVNPIQTPVVNNKILNTAVSWGLGREGVEVAPGTVPTAATPPIARQLSDLPAIVYPNPAWDPNNVAFNARLHRSALSSPHPGINHPMVYKHEAVFNNFQVWGVTSNNVQLTVDIGSDASQTTNNNNSISSLANTTATVNIVAGPAVGIAPVMIPDPINTQQMVRVPSNMFIGRVSPTFYAQAVDQFGNRVSGDPTCPGDGYNNFAGGATVSIPAVGVTKVTNLGAGCVQGSAADAGVVITANQKAFTITSGNTAQAVRGLYTFNSFIPGSPASDSPLDVTLCFSDPALLGATPLQPGAFPPVFNVIPPVTTANTTFNAVPKVSVVAGNAAGGAVASVNNLALIERKATFGTNGYGGTDAAFQSGSLIIQRPVGTTGYPAIVGYTLAYADSANAALPNIGAASLQLPVPMPAGAVTVPPYPAPTSVAINGLQGDLAPTTAGAAGQVAVNIATSAAPNSVTLAPGVTSQALNFTARWSDQSFSPRNAGIQKERKVTVTLLPDAAGTVYDLDTQATGTVTLNDPPQTAPVILNAIQDKQLKRTEQDLIELETAGFRADGLPNTVFYEDNFDPLTYTVEVSDPTVVTAEIIAKDDRFGGRPSLKVATQANAPFQSQAKVKVIASDGRGGTGTDEFVVTVVSGITANVVAPAEVGLTVAPNPTSGPVSVEARAKNTGTVRIKLVNLLGNEVAAVNVNAIAGNVYKHTFNVDALANGFYSVVITDGNVTSSQRVQVAK